MSALVCIIGAGPAGATTSLFLSQKKIPHLLLDAARFPRDKVCGDGLDLKVVRVMRQFNPALVEEEWPRHPHFLPLSGARFILPNGRHSDFAACSGGQGRFPGPLVWCCKRLHFDHYLVQKLDPAYADFRPGTAVERLIRAGRQWVVEARTSDGRALEIRTPLVVGADGDHSVVLRSLGARKIDRRHYAGTLRQYWQGVEGFASDPLLEVYFPKDLPMSYFYLFPLPQGECNVGYGMVSDVLAQKKEALRSVFQRIIQSDPHIAWRFRNARPLEKPVGWGLPLASRRRRCSGDGYLLAGDAASLVSPTSGEGIGTAMMSGYIAAQFIERAVALRRFDAAVFSGYDREIRRRLQGEIRQYRLLRALPPSLYEACLNGLARAPIFQWLFQREVEGWMRTAYKTPIAVQF